MSALSCWEFAVCCVIACGLAVAVLGVVLSLLPSGDRGDAVAAQDAPDPVDEQFYTAAAVLQPDMTPLADQVEAWLSTQPVTEEN